MGQKVPPGLIKRGEIWHVRKTIGGKRIRESTGTGSLAEAEKYLAHLIEESRKVEIYGARKKRLFRDAAVKHLQESTKASIDRDADLIQVLDPLIGGLPLEAVHMGSLQGYIQTQRAAGWKKRTINYGLQVVRHILNLAAGEWMDGNGKTWLAHAPKIKLLREDDKKEPYPLSWDEQRRLFDVLPEHLRRMVLFKVNTGCREQEVCQLRWEWEEVIPEMGTSVFILPGPVVKNRDDRLVVLNRIARTVIEQVRGEHETYVFTYRGNPVTRMYNTSWKKARKRVGLPGLRVHDLKHTFGRRLRAAGVSFEDRQDLLGHKSGRITTHYSMPELENLIAAANKICGVERHTIDTMVILRKKRHLASVS